MQIKDAFRALYTVGMAYVTGDPGKFVLGVDPAGLYRGIAVNGAGAIISANGVSASPTYQSAFSVAAQIGHAIEIKPSATKTIQLLEIYISKPTAGTVVSVVKQSIADTMGTSSAQTIVPLSSGNAASASTLLAYTAAPTPGTAVGTILIDSMGTSDRIDYNAGLGPDQPVILLKNTTESLVVNTSVAGTLTFMLKWLEV